MHVLEYLDELGGKATRTPSLTVWTEDPTIYEQQWTDLPRESACVYDFVSTSCLIDYLVSSRDLDYRSSALRGKRVGQTVRGAFAAVDARILHQFLFYDRVYLNVTNSIKEHVRWEELERHGLTAIYPRPPSKEIAAVHAALKPMLIRYIGKLYLTMVTTGLLPVDMWRDGINLEKLQSLDVYFSFLYDEMSKHLAGEKSYYLSLLALLSPVGMSRIGDLFEEVLDGFSAMTHDSLAMFTLSPPAPAESSRTNETVLRDDTFALFQVAVGDELGFAPRADTLQDVLRLREQKDVHRFRELIGQMNSAIKRSDESLLKEMRTEILNAKQKLKRIEFVNSRPYVWATTLLGFVPILGQVLGATNLITYEVAELTKKRNNWIYLGLR